MTRARRQCFFSSFLPRVFVLSASWIPANFMADGNESMETSHPCIPSKKAQRTSIHSSSSPSSPIQLALHRAGVTHTRWETLALDRQQFVDYRLVTRCAENLDRPVLDPLPGRLGASLPLLPMSSFPPPVGIILGCTSSFPSIQCCYPARANLRSCPFDASRCLMLGVSCHPHQSRSPVQCLLRL